MTTTIHEPIRKASKGASESFVHAAALCESNAVGEGTRIWAFAHVLDGAVLGRGCNVGDHAYIESGVRIGDRVTILESRPLSRDKRWVLQSILRRAGQTVDVNV